MPFRKILELFQKQATEPPDFSILFKKFQQILQGNNTVLETIAQMEDKLSGEYIFDMNYIRSTYDKMSETVYKIIYALNVLSSNGYPELFSRYEAINFAIAEIVEGTKKRTSGEMVVLCSKAEGDMGELLGSKSARLCEARKYLGVNVPEGFVITTAAYHQFMDANRLWPQIREILDKGRSQTLSMAEQSKQIEELFKNAAVPPHIEREIQRAVGEIFGSSSKRVFLAVRSSAWGEDGETQSFAGQFKTLLNQRAADLLDAYKEVLAGRFSESALAYYDFHADEDAVPMAVACQRMIPAVTSGIIYTVDPGGALDRLLITSVLGLGEKAVSGAVEMDQYAVSRYHPFPIFERRIAQKKSRLVLGPDGRLIEEAVPEPQQSTPCLSDEQVTRLTERAMGLERHFRRPQDIEWAIDEKGEIVILQSRPLSIQEHSLKKGKSLSESLSKYPLLLSDRGQIVQRGFAAGKVVRFLEDDAAENFPQGGIAVTRHTTPRLTKVIRKTAAIVTDVGSPTGHMATVAREFGVPTIVGAGNATSVLKEGMEITVDAEENRIYSGIIPEVLEYQMQGKDQFMNLPEFRILKKILNKVAPLNLTDPTSREFIERNCQTFHDILRFCHEKAVAELINLHVSERRFRNFKSRELRLQIPIGLHVIDMGNGLGEGVGSRTIKSLDQVRSVPMRAILEGLTAPGAWSTEAKSLSFDDFMSSLTRFSLFEPHPQYLGQNLAVITDRYTNLSLRLGYHFNVIDAYLSDNINDNYIYFRFVGGVTELERRRRRGELIQKVLEKYDFKVMLTNDLVVARIKKREQEHLQKILVMLGRLIGFTRQLDTEMISDRSVEVHAAAFLEAAAEIC